MDYYYDLCKDCEYLYHCFGRDTGKKISDGDVDDMCLLAGTCRNFYPELRQ